jgi:endonuclease YncB( thermonuclease family)
MLRPSGRGYFISGLAIAASLAFVATAAALSTMTAASAASRKGLTICPMQGESQARVKGVDERLDIALADGRILHIAGLDPPRPTPDAPGRDSAARDQLAAKLLGQNIGLLPVAQKPDRWGRIPVLAFQETLSRVSSEPDSSLAVFLLRAGLARVKPQAEIRPCLKEWLATEADARSRRLGLWADPYYAIIAADDSSGFAEKAATDVIVEGRLAEAASSQFGLRLKLGSGRGRGFSVIILQRNIKIFERASMNFNSLIGRSLRVRGLLDTRFGPQIEIASPDEIELIVGEENKAELAVRAKTPATITQAAPEEP